MDEEIYKLISHSLTESTMANAYLINILCLKIAEDNYKLGNISREAFEKVLLNTTNLIKNLTDLNAKREDV